MPVKHHVAEAKTPEANRQIGELLGLGFLESELHFVFGDNGAELVASDRDSIMAFLRRSRLPLHAAEAALLANEEENHE